MPPTHLDPRSGLGARSPPTRSPHRRGTGIDIKHQARILRIFTRSRTKLRFERHRQSPNFRKLASHLPPTDWRSSDRAGALTPFQKAVYELICWIPKGRAATYGVIAAVLNNSSSQAVGNALAVNPLAPTVPCHRVLKKEGTGATLGGFSGVAQSAGASNCELSRKLDLLKTEGVAFDARLRLVHPERVLFQATDFSKEAVAAALKHLGAGSAKLGSPDSSSASSSSASHKEPPMDSATDLRASLSVAGSSNGLDVRMACRDGRLKGQHTSGLAPGYAQANLVILPKEYARDFLAFCTRNPKPCPLLETTEVGDPRCPITCPSGCDIRTDLPRYRVWRDGKLSEEVDDVKALWPDKLKAGAAAHPDARDDWVAFLLGCSFSFEEALLKAGLPVRHLQEEKGGAAEEDGAASSSSEPAAKRAKKSPDEPEPLASNPRNVPMYRTCVPCVPAGPFSGPLVVSMRPMTPAQAKEAAAITSDFQRVHGRPVYAGPPSAIGIDDINSPHYGDRVTIREGEVPVFWACGVTPQAALIQAKVPIAITHAPGHMAVLDRLNAELSGPAELDVGPYLKDKSAVNHVALAGH